jgi:hypothetical protein
MKYRQVTEISKCYEDFRDFTDEFIFKSMLHKLIEYMPIKALENIFELIKIDPNSEESRKKLSDLKTRIGEKEFIQMLKQRELIRYEVMIQSKNSALDDLEITYGDGKENSSEKHTIS